MASDYALMALTDILNVNRIPARDMIFDFFVKIRADGKLQEKLIIGMTKTTIVLLKREHEKRVSPLVYHMLPLSKCQVFFSCVHRAEMTLQVSGDDPLRVVMADCGRSAKDMSSCWQKWTDFTFEPENSKISRKKNKVRQGNYAFKEFDCDPFQAHTMTDKGEFLVDESYFHFWLQSGSEKQATVMDSQHDKSYGRRKSLHKALENNSHNNELTGCCGNIC